MKRLLPAALMLAALIAVGTDRARAQTSGDYSLSNAQMAQDLMLLANGINNNFQGPMSNNDYATAYVYESDGTIMNPKLTTHGVGPVGSSGWFSYTDCSGWVSYLLSNVPAAASAYAEAVRLQQGQFAALETGYYWPRAYLYNYYLRTQAPKLSALQAAGATSSPSPLINVDTVAALQPGDILSYCLTSWCNGQFAPGDTGHIMLVVGTPILATKAVPNALAPEAVAVYQVPVVDSTILSHNIYPAGSGLNTIPNLQGNFAATGYPAPMTIGTWQWDIRRNFNQNCSQFNPSTFSPGVNLPCGGVGPGYMNIAVNAQGQPIQFQFADFMTFNPPNPSQPPNATAGALIAAGRVLPSFNPTSTAWTVGNQQ